MPFPNLLRRPDPSSPDGLSALFVENTGVPDNGANTFEIPYVDDPPAGSGIDADEVDDDWMVIDVVPLGVGVTGATYGSLDATKRFMTINFAADGVESARVTVQLIHSFIR